jgi:hypothetical protein
MSDLTRKGFLGAVAAAVGAPAVVPGQHAEAAPARVPAAFWKAAARERTEVGQSLADLGSYVERAEPEELEALGNCLSTFVAFIHDAKEEEIELLDKMLWEWGNHCGSLRQGNFFQEVARTISNGEDTRALLKWPVDQEAVNA